MPETREGRFALDVAAWCEKAKGNADKVVRALALEALKRIVMRTPVGNPDLWLSLNPYVDLKSGKLRTARKPPPGYAGGRLRRNWQIGIDEPPAGEVAGVDANGGNTIAEGAVKLQAAGAGHVVWIINNLPYAIPIEYGSSTQAPAGCVRVTVAELNSLIAEAVKGLS